MGETNRDLFNLWREEDSRLFSIKVIISEREPLEDAIESKI